jgi:hypothetical protein
MEENIRFRRKLPIKEKDRRKNEASI